MTVISRTGILKLPVCAALFIFLLLGMGVAISDHSITSASATSTGSIFANCSISGGCIANCAPPTVDPIATGNTKYDLYDGCILAGMDMVRMNQTWQGQILKAQMMAESGINPLYSPGTYNCGGMNCGPWAISAGSISGDSAPGPCGSSSTDPFTGVVDYSHSYGLFQSTPACDGVFSLTTSLSGHTCTPTTKADMIPFGSSVYFYCESKTSKSGHYIDATQDQTSSLYAKSVFNPAYQVYVYFAQWQNNFKQANSKATGCTMIQQWYLTLAYWLTGSPQSSCTLSSGVNYVTNIINDYQNRLYDTAWPFIFSVTSTTTTVTPNPTSAIIGKTITFTGQVADISNSISPANTLSWRDGGAGGTFTVSGSPGNTCKLSSASSSESSCKVTYTPPSTAPSGTIVTITASYSGDTNHKTSSGTSSLKIFRTTSTVISPYKTSVLIGGHQFYTVTVSDTTSSGTKIAPTGSVSWKANVLGGSFSSGTCTLTAISSSQSSCQIKYTAPTVAVTVTITGTYSGDSTHTNSDGKAKLAVS